MATITTIIASIIASLANIPMTLESSINFPVGHWDAKTATLIFMRQSPFYISMTSNGGIQLTNSKGEWITRTSPIIEANTFDNGYCYFVTENGHKYQFTLHITADKANYIKARNEVYSTLSLEDAIFEMVFRMGYYHFNTENRSAIYKACNELEEKGRTSLFLERKGWFDDTIEKEEYRLFAKDNQLIKLIKVVGEYWNEQGYLEEEHEVYDIRYHCGRPCFFKR